MSVVSFDSPAKRIIREFDPKNKFDIDTSLPDIAFKRQLAIQGRMRYFNGADNTVPISVVPPVGETLFIGGGGFTMHNLQTTNTIVTTVDGNRVSRQFSPANRAVFGIFDFGILSMVGNNIREFRVVAGTTDATYYVWGWVENTSRLRDAPT